MTDARIYTKMGDDGSTGLLFGGRVSKADILIDTVGAIDETVATLGLARSFDIDPGVREIVLHIQRDLFVVGADLIAQPRARDQLIDGVSRVTPAMVGYLEQTVDRLMEEKPLRPVFIVPGANPASAALDVARAQVRTAERRLVAYRNAARRDHPDAGPNPQVGLYLNRVSDVIFVLARHAAGDDEEPASHDTVG